MRLDGWETRLNQVIEEARARPYVLGEHDCFHLACAVVHALTGVDRWPEFAGTYRTRREALARIAEHGSTFEAAGNWFFNGQAIAVNFAQRGDIVAFYTQHQFHLGVMMGAQFAGLLQDGIAHAPREHARLAWRVG